MELKTNNVKTEKKVGNSMLSRRQKIELNAIKTKYGKPMENSDYLEKIEFFVVDVIKVNQIDALLKLNRDDDNVPSWIWAAFIRMSGFIKAICQLPRRYSYTNCINLFIESCEVLGLIGDDLDDARRGRANFSIQTDHHWTSFIQLIEIIFREGNHQSFKTKLLNAFRTIDYRKKEFSRFVNALFNAHSRIVVLRIDFEYQKAFARIVSLSEALDDLDHLVANMRSNAMFDDMVGYIFKVEYGVDRGVHIHSILFFNGAIRNGANHIGHAKQIGEYWKNRITLGRGAYWNVNANIELYRRRGECGIGLIHFSENDLIANLLDLVIHYVCKEQQMIRSESEPDRKMIRKKYFPRVYEVKRGRPRNVMDGSALN